MVMQMVDGIQPITATSSMSIFKFTATAESKNSLADVIGASEISGLAKNRNYLIAYFDAKALLDDKGQSNNPVMVIAVVNAGDDGKLMRAAVETASISIVGILPMDAAS